MVPRVKLENPVRAVYDLQQFQLPQADFGQVMIEVVGLHLGMVVCARHASAVS